MPLHLACRCEVGWEGEVALVEIREQHVAGVEEARRWVDHKGATIELYGCHLQQVPLFVSMCMVAQMCIHPTSKQDDWGPYLLCSLGHEGRLVDVMLNHLEAAVVLQLDELGRVCEEPVDALLLSEGKGLGACTSILPVSTLNTKQRLMLLQRIVR